MQRVRGLSHHTGGRVLRIKELMHTRRTLVQHSRKLVRLGGVVAGRVGHEFCPTGCENCVPGVKNGRAVFKISCAGVENRYRCS